MKERQIPFSAPMVRALLEDRKTQTRRIIKPQPDRVANWFTWSPPGFDMIQNGGNVALAFKVEELDTGLRRWAEYCPYGVPGDRLRVADVSPISLEVCSVRVERLQNISEDDARVEGVVPTRYLKGNPFVTGALNAQFSGETSTHKMEFRLLWESTYGPGSWDANPWVWAIEFKRIQP